MLSRIAENLYWMARYMERAENTARLINAITLMLLDMPRARFGWDSLIKITGLDQLFFEHFPHADENTIINFLLYDDRNPSSIINSISHARENTRSFREILPWESWEWINELYLYAKGHLHGDLDRRRRYDILQGIIRRRQSIIGLMTGTMSRDESFQFLRIGRNIERADMTTRLVDVSHALILPSQEENGTSPMDLLWINILKSLSAYQAFRRFVGIHPFSHDVVNFLLKENLFPRTVIHCILEISDALESLPKNDKLKNCVTNYIKIISEFEASKLHGKLLHEYLDSIQAGLGDIDRHLQQAYFRQAESQQQQPNRFVECAS